MKSALIGTVNFCRKSLVIVELEVRKMIHDPTEVLMRAVQPVLWLLLFGEVFAQTRAIPTGNLGYLDFLTPGILAQSVLFIAIFGGITVIWERDLGIVHKFLASPTPRGALALGKVLSGGARALTQAVIVYVLALLIGVKMNWNPLALLGVIITVVLAATLFSAFSLTIAFLVRTRERFMGIGQVLTMPFFFASNAIYPVAIMPPWLQVVSRGNPLTYEVDALRALMLAKGDQRIWPGDGFRSTDSVHSRPGYDLHISVSARSHIRYILSPRPHTSALTIMTASFRSRFVQLRLNDLVLISCSVHLIYL